MVAPKMLEDIDNLEKEYLTPKEVAKVLGCSPYSINVQAKKNQKALGFPVIIIGTRVLIPKQAFLNFMRYGYEHHEGKKQI